MRFPPPPFAARLAQAVATAGTPLCVGIDPWPDRLPGARPGDSRDTLAALAARFGHAVVNAVVGQVAAVKPQFAFFEQLGPPGMAALAEVCAAATEAGLVVVGDAKRGDIGSTAAAYAAATLAPDAPFRCDALTVSPFLGPDTLEPFLAAADAAQGGLFVLLRTSNAGSARWQAPVADDLAGWLTDAGAARQGADGLSNVGAVVGATHPGALAAMRSKLPHAWLLVPGFGAQGGTARDVAAAARSDGLGALIVSARGATFPDKADGAYDADPTTWIRARVADIVSELRAEWPRFGVVR
ncbi:MAG: orotidine-5'-phosphate decarboxylase [Pseudomonadota bacterium]|nr:orotidine-5'-phosphate decarboxylase [Pseudomonadota bacterium]